jgi:hypothetical protein
MCELDRAGHDRIGALCERSCTSSSPPDQTEEAEAEMPANNPDAAHAAELDDSIRKLLKQGRKIDAILLVESTSHLELWN